MPKKGVFGNKAMPMDEVRPSAPAMPAHPKTLEIRAAKTGGYIVSIRGGNDGYTSDEHACKSMESVIKLIGSHFGTEEKE